MPRLSSQQHALAAKFYAVNTKDASGKSTTYVMISKDGQKPAVDSDGQPFKE